MLSCPVRPAFRTAPGWIGWETSIPDGVVGAETDPLGHRAVLLLRLGKLLLGTERLEALLKKTALVKLVVPENAILDCVSKVEAECKKRSQISRLCHGCPFVLRGLCTSSQFQQSRIRQHLPRRTLHCDADGWFGTRWVGLQSGRLERSSSARNNWQPEIIFEIKGTSLYSILRFENGVLLGSGYSYRHLDGRFCSVVDDGAFFL